MPRMFEPLQHGHLNRSWQWSAVMGQPCNTERSKGGGAPRQTQGDHRNHERLHAFLQSSCTTGFFGFSTAYSTTLTAMIPPAISGAICMEASGLVIAL